MIMSRLTGGNLLKALMMMGIGLALGTVGMETVAGYMRYTFKQPALAQGIDFLPVAMGLFGISEVPREARAEAARALGAGPRADFAAIRERLQRASPTVTRFAWVGYDRFLRAHRVPEGVACYDQVVRLIAGTTFDEAWRPRLRHETGTHDGLTTGAAPGVTP